MATDLSGFEQCRPHPWHGLCADRASPRFSGPGLQLDPLHSIKGAIEKLAGRLRLGLHRPPSPTRQRGEGFAR